MPFSSAPSRGKSLAPKDTCPATILSCPLPESVAVYVMVACGSTFL